MQAQTEKDDNKGTPTKGTKKRKSEKKFKKESTNARKYSESSDEPTSASNICDNDKDESETETATKIGRVSVRLQYVWLKVLCVYLVYQKMRSAFSFFSSS